MTFYLVNLSILILQTRSIGTQVIKTTVLIVLCATLGMSLHSFSSTKKTTSNDEHTLTQLQRSYKTALTVAPDKKTVTTNYQKAIDAAKEFRDASQKNASSIKSIWARSHNVILMVS